MLSYEIIIKWHFSKLKKRRKNNFSIKKSIYAYIHVWCIHLSIYIQTPSTSTKMKMYIFGTSFSLTLCPHSTNHHQVIIIWVLHVGLEADGGSSNTDSHLHTILMIIIVIIYIIGKKPFPINHLSSSSLKMPTCVCEWLYWLIDGLIDWPSHAHTHTTRHTRALCYKSF